MVLHHTGRAVSGPGYNISQAGCFYSSCNGNRGCPGVPGNMSLIPSPLSLRVFCFLPGCLQKRLKITGSTTNNHEDKHHKLVHPICFLVCCCNHGMYRITPANKKWVQAKQKQTKSATSSIIFVPTTFANHELGRSNASNSSSKVHAHCTGTTSRFQSKNCIIVKRT